MTPRRGKPGRRPLRAGFELVQSDLSMNIFVALLSVLSVLTLASSLLAADGFRVPYKAEQPADRTLGLVRSWKPILQINPHILVKDGRAYRLDLRRLAIAFAKGKPVVRSENYDDSTRLLAGDLDPSAFRVFLYLHRDKFPAELTSYSFEVARISQAADDTSYVPPQLMADITDHSAIDIFFHANDSVDAWAVARLLKVHHVSFRLVILENSTVFAFERATSRFAFEDVYK